MSQVLARWLPVAFLAGGAVALIVWITLHQGLSEASLGGLLGALIGAAAILSGVLIDRGQGRAERDRAAVERRDKLKSLVTAELVSVAGGLTDADGFVDAAVRAPISLTASSAELADYVTRPMPFTSNLGVELLALSPGEIDALSMLRSSLSQTETLMLKEKDGKQILTPERLRSIRVSIRRDMLILADVFDTFAPGRMLALDGSTPEPASALLRRLGDKDQG